MAIAQNLFRQIAIGKQAALGTLALTSVGQLYNFRPDTSGGLSKESFESDSIRRDQQFSNPRHGLRSGVFTLSQELQLGGHTELWEAALGAVFDVTPATTGSSVDMALDAAARTITRTSGSFITDGFKVGDIVRATGYTNSVNNGTNLRLTAVTATVLTFADDAWLPTLVTEAAGDTVTIAVPGGVLSVPSTGHTADYLTIDDFHDDINQQTTIQDARVSSVAIDVSPGAQATVTWEFLGTDADLSGTTQYFNAPTAASTGALLAGPEGLVRYDDADSAVVSALSFSIDRAAEVKAVVGANVSPDVFTAGVRMTGSISALFDGGAVLTNFDDEAEGTMYLYLFADSTRGSEFLILKLPNVKINSADKSTDGQALQVSGDFSAGKYVGASTVIEGTTLVVVDSTVTA